MHQVPFDSREGSFCDQSLEGTDASVVHVCTVHLRLVMRELEVNLLRLMAHKLQAVAEGDLLMA